MIPVEQFGFSEIFFYKITLDTHQVYIIRDMYERRFGADHATGGGVRLTEVV